MIFVKTKFFQTEEWDLDDEINRWLKGIQVRKSNSFSLIDITYSSVKTSNSPTRYTALVIYRTYEEAE